MRRPRIKAEGAGYYHPLRFMRILRMSFGATNCMSRAIERRFIFDAHLKNKFLNPPSSGGVRNLLSANTTTRFLVGSR